MDERYVRTPADVREVIKHAKLLESDLAPLTQVIRIAESDPKANNYRLLQLDDHLTEEILNRRPVHFKGDRDENAVLCTSSRTYDIKEAETSNSLLMIPGLLWSQDAKVVDEEFEADNNAIIESPRKILDRDVVKIFYTYYEGRACKPNMRKLGELLQNSIYSGPEKEYAIDKNFLLTWDRLRCTIRASDLELRRGLCDLKAIEIDGFYRVLSFDYEFRVLSQMLDFIEENSWPLDRIKKSETVDTLADLSLRVIVETLFNYYSLETEEIDGEQFYKYDDVKVSRIFAQYILKDAGKFNLSDFLEVWKNSVPEGMNAELEMLCGIALYDKNSSPQVIWAFHESRLPENINERLKVLFETKEKWTVEEIAPYMEVYTTEKLNVNALLTKYARGSMHNNVRYYSAKHSK